MTSQNPEPESDTVPEVELVELSPAIVVSKNDATGMVKIKFQKATWLNDGTMAQAGDIREVHFSDLMLPTDDSEMDGGLYAQTKE
jgi:hypothetical protein